MIRCERARCGRSFVPKRWNQRFCKPSCSNTERVSRCKKRNAKQVPLIGRFDTCDHCGDQFVSVSTSQVGGERKRYCKDECRFAARKTKRILSN